MRKAHIYILAVALVVSGLLGMVGCAGVTKPCTVKLNYISDLWLGAEVYVGEISFTVENPNNTPVSLSSFSYALSVKSEEGFTKVYEKIGLPEIYIPAKGKVDLNLPFFVSWYEGLFVPKYTSVGVDAVSAAVFATKVYKLLGAKKPSFAALQAAIDGTWGAAPAGPPTDFAVNVSFDMLTGKDVVTVPPVELRYNKQ